MQYLVSKDYSALWWSNYCTFLQGLSARLQGLSLNIGLKQHKGNKSKLVSLPYTVVMAASIFVKNMFVCLIVVSIFQFFLQFPFLVKWEWRAALWNFHRRKPGNLTVEIILCALNPHSMTNIQWIHSIGSFPWGKAAGTLSRDIYIATPSFSPGTI